MNKYQKLASNTLIFAIGQIGTKLMSFVLIRLYTSCLTTEQWSVTDLIYQAVNVLYPIVTFCMADAIIRYGIDKEYDNKKVFTTAMLLTTGGLILLALFTPLLNLTSYFGGYAFLLYVWCYCSSFRQIASNFVRAKGYVKLFVVDNMLAILTTVIFNVLFLVVFKMGIAGYALSIILSDTLSFLTLTVIAGLHKYFDLRNLQKSLFVEMLKYAVPLIPSYILWWITAASDRFFIINMVGDSANGLYSASSKIPNLLMLVTTFIFQAWQMSSIENKDDAGISKFFGQVFNSYCSMLFIGAAGLILLTKPLSALLLADDFFAAYTYTPVLVIAMVFQSLCQFISSVYNVRKKSINSMLTALVAAVVNIILNFLLIPDYGVYGAAIATAASYFACFAVRIFDARCYIPFRVNFVKLLINLIVVVYMAFAAIKEPKLVYLQLVTLFIVIVIFNLEAIVTILKRILGKGVKKKA